MGKIVKLTLAFCGVLLLVVIGQAGWFTWLPRRQPPDDALPKLVRALPDGDTHANVEFRHRVEARFPLGMAETKLVAGLKAQGFHIRKTIASFSQRDTPCNRIWTIFWNADADDRVTRLQTNDSPNCP